MLDRHAITQDERWRKKGLKVELENAVNSSKGKELKLAKNG